MANSLESSSTGGSIIAGGAGNDALLGASGNDTMDGGGGSDALNAGGGNDTLIYRLGENAGASDIYSGGSGIDTLTLQLTQAEWADAAVRAQIGQYLTFLGAASLNSKGELTNSGSNNFVFRFPNGSTLMVQMIERLVVQVQNTSGQYVTVDPFATLIQGHVTGSVTEDGVDAGVPTVTGDLSGDDINGPDDAFRAGTGTAAYGSYTVSSTGVWAYTLDNAHPDVDALETGGTLTDSFTVLALDGTAQLITVTIHGSDDKPIIIIAPDAAAIKENQLIAIDVLANDSSGRDALTLVSVAAPSGKGTASVLDNKLVFDPGSDFDHLAQGATEVVIVSYTMRDEHGSTADSTATITVTGTNDLPTITPWWSVTEENYGITVPVLNGSIDVDDGDSVTLGSAVAFGGGSASVVNDELVWEPGTDFDHLAEGATATVNVVYEVRDAWSATLATLPVTVTGKNDTPDAVADTATCNENAELTIDVLANDTDVDDGHVFTLLSASAPSDRGTATVVSNQLRFTPGTSFDHLGVGASEVVHVSYEMRDEHGATSTSVAEITVTGTNDMPVAGEDEAAGYVGQTLTIDVLANDTDPDAGDILTLIDVYSTPNITARIVDGKLVATANPILDRLPHGVAAAQDLIHYWVQDQNGSGTYGVARVQFTGVNDAPVARADAASGEENSTLTINVLGNDSDVDGDTLSLTSVSVPIGKGTAAVVGKVLDDLNIYSGGQLQFTPGTSFDHLAQGESEVVTVSYTMQDRYGAQSSSTIAITVTGTNDAAVVTGASSGNVTATIGGDVTPASGVVQGDLQSTDVDGTADLFQSATSVATVFGTYSVTSAGEWTYAPNPANATLQSGEGATDSFDVLTQDGTSTTINISIAVNHAPTRIALDLADSDNLQVARLHTTDLDAGDSHTYSIVGDAGPFVISGDALNVAGDISGSYSLSICSTDAAGATVTKDVDVFIGTAGNDVTDSAWINAALLYGGGGGDHIYGGAGDDWLFGQAGNDELFGGAGNDQIYGGDGNDLLIGGSGIDRLDGGNGNDQFVFNSPMGVETYGFVNDFTVGVDKFVLENTGVGRFNALDTGALAAGAFVDLSSPGAAVTANTRITYDGVMLKYDADGSGAGAAVLIAFVSMFDGRLSSTDFLVI